MASGFRGAASFTAAGNAIPGSEPAHTKGRDVLKKRVVTWSIASARAARTISCGSSRRRITEAERCLERRRRLLSGRGIRRLAGLQRLWHSSSPDNDWSPFPPLLTGLTSRSATRSRQADHAREWGVGEFPKNGSKPDFIREAFAEMKASAPESRCLLARTLAE